MKLAELVKEMDYESLLAVKEEVSRGQLLAAVEERIASFENPNRVCPECGNAVEPRDAITLHFGPKDLRQRASFDGQDCLRSFLFKNEKYGRY